MFALYKRKVSALSKELINKENEISLLNEEFHKRLEHEIQNNKSKDKIIYEQSKLSSMRELITNIAHQWRQPLSVISVAATSVKLYEENGMLQTKKVVENCTVINENAQYLSQTLDSFSDFVNDPRDKKAFRIKQIVESLKKLTSFYSSSLGIKIEYIYKEDFTIYSHKNEIVQVLLNLINNSREAFEKNSIEDRFIFIEFKLEDKIFSITLKDNAGGINEKTLPRVFEPYFTTKHQSQGAGLGLYIAHKIVTKKLKGEIEVENVEFEGVSVAIRLPRT